MINARLREAEKGSFYGPFRNGDEIAEFLKKKDRRGKSRVKAKNSR